MSTESDGWESLGYKLPAVDPATPKPESNQLSTTPAPTELSAAERAKSGPSQATELVQLARTLYEVVRGDDSKLYAVALAQPGVAFTLRGDAGLRQQLAAAYYDAKNRAASGSALSDALAVLEGDALRASETRVNIRVGMHQGAVIVDLGTNDARAVRIDSKGWSMLDKSPILFRRNKLTSALVEPERFGSLDALQGMLNLDERRFRLVVGWIVAALLPDIPQPLLALTGQQGTAKTTAARTVLSLIDPSPASMQSQPRTEEDWAVAAFNSYGVGIDNVSKMLPWFQDALCKAVTGDAFVRRERYSDDSPSVLKFRRPIALTTIDPGALQGDVADRLLPVELSPISRKERRTDAELTEQLERIRPRTLGALYGLLSAVLAQLPRTKLDEKPRMADFALVLAALDIVTEWNTLPDYLSAVAAAAQDVVEGDSFAVALVAFAERAGTWQGTCAELLGELGDGPHPADWPRTPRGVSGRLSRISQALATRGVRVDRQPRGNNGTRYLIASTSTQVCAVCRNALSPVLVAAGHDTHPNCQNDLEEGTK